MHSCFSPCCLVSRRQLLMTEDNHSEHITSAFRRACETVPQHFSQPHIVTCKCGLHLGSPIQTSTNGIAGCSMEGYPVLFKSGSTSNYGNAPQIKSKTLWN